MAFLGKVALRHTKCHTVFWMRPVPIPLIHTFPVALFPGSDVLAACSVTAGRSLAWSLEILDMDLGI